MAARNANLFVPFQWKVSTFFSTFWSLREQIFCSCTMRSGYAGNESPARAESSVGAISHQQTAEAFTDGAESRPLQSVGDHSVGVSFADNTLRTSVNSVSAAVGESADEPTAEIVTSAPILLPDQAEEVSRPTDDQIIAQENSIRSVCSWLAFLSCTSLSMGQPTFHRALASFCAYVASYCERGRLNHHIPRSTEMGIIMCMQGCRGGEDALHGHRRTPVCS